MTTPSPASFKASLRSRLQTAARQTRRPASALRREFFMQRFLARVFDDPTAHWVVTGGGGLLVRLPGARSSQDLDIIRLDVEISEAIDELRHLGGARPDIDPFVFQVELAKQLTGEAAAGAELTVSIYLGANVVEDFHLDLAVDKVIIGDIESLTPVAVLELEGFASLPPVRLIPIPSRAADKICAMVARYGTTRQPSSRWRDLADLCFIVDNFAFDAAETRTALDVQQERRGIELPTALHPPGPEWARSYPSMAKETTLPPELHRLDDALAFVGNCFKGTTSSPNIAFTAPLVWLAADDRLFPAAYFDARYPADGAAAISPVTRIVIAVAIAVAVWDIGEGGSAGGITHIATLVRRRRSRVTPSSDLREAASESSSRR